MNTEEQIADLQKRMAYQESIHKDITLDPNAFLHGIINNGAIIMISVTIATGLLFFLFKPKIA